MKLLLRIGLHELRRVSRDRAFFGLIVAFALVSGYAAWNGQVWSQQRQSALAQTAAQAEETRSAYLEKIAKTLRGGRQTPTYTLLAVGLQHHLTLPVVSMAPLTVGQAEGYPYEARFHALSPTHDLFTAPVHGLENPATLAAGRLDLAFVIVVLLPLVLIAGTYDLWTAERENGTSAFLLSQPVSPTALLIGKALARGGTLLIAVTGITVAALAVTTTLQGPVNSYLALSAIVLLYGSFWIALALAANVLMRQTTTTALACGTVWLFVVWLLPAMLSAGLDLLRPAPSAAEHVNALRLHELELRNVPASAAVSSCPAPGLDRSIAARRNLGHIESQDLIFAPLVEAYETQHTERRRLAQTLRVISAAIAAADALERIAGTDAERAIAFQKQVVEFQEQWRAIVASRAAVPAVLGVEAAGHTLPRFHFREPDVPNETNYFALLAALAIPCALLAWGLRRRALIVNETGVDR
jgi:ABC-2 type transport system permease protein